VLSKITILDAYAPSLGSFTGTSNEIGLYAVNVEEITADAWLANVNQNTIGTLGLGIGSALWWNQTDQMLIDPTLNMTAYQLYTGPVNDWTAFG
jgi:hypothetical protein